MAKDLLLHGKELMERFPEGRLFLADLGSKTTTIPLAAITEVKMTRLPSGGSTETKLQVQYTTEQDSIKYLEMKAGYHHEKTLDQVFKALTGRLNVADHRTQHKTRLVFGMLFLWLGGTALVAFGTACAADLAGGLLPPSVWHVLGGVVGVGLAAPLSLWLFSRDLPRLGTVCAILVSVIMSATFGQIGIVLLGVGVIAPMWIYAIWFWQIATRTVTTTVSVRTP